MALIAILLLISPSLGHIDGSVPRMNIEGRLQLPPNAGQSNTKEGNAANAIHISNVKVSLNGGEFSAITKRDGSFIFYNVPTGVYSLDVHSVNIFFPAAKVKVVAGKGNDQSNEESSSTENQSVTDQGTISVVEYKYPGAARTPVGYPIVLRALAPLMYFQPKQQFSILGMIMANPMMSLMLLIGGGMVLVIQNIDPETMKEIQEQQKQQGQEDPMQQVQKMMSGGGLGALFGGNAKHDEEDD